MATITSKTRCTICDKEKATFKCGGCSNEYCYHHLEDHRQELNRQLDQIEIHRDIIRQSLTEQIEQSNNNSLIQQIDTWEYNSIKIIQQFAEETRQILINTTNEYFHQTETKLTKFTNELREIRQENDFNELNLRHFEEELTQLTKELTKPSNISIREDSTSFINKLSVNVSRSSTFKSNIHYNTKWMHNGYTVAGGNGNGNRINQLDSPYSMYVDDVDDDRTIYVADFNNNRIVEWKCDAVVGQVVTNGDGLGHRTNHLNGPTDVIVDHERNNLIICDQGNRQIVRWPNRNGATGQIIISNIDCCRLAMNNNGDLYVSDYEKDEVRRWKIDGTVGTLVAGGNGKGNQLNQLNTPTFIFVDEDHSVYVTDCNNHRVMKWIEGAIEGIVVAGGHSEGNGLIHLSRPQGLIVDHLGTVFVADTRNHRIMRWSKGATQGDIIVGGNGRGEQANQLNRPAGLSFDREGNLYVVDCHNHRIQKFDIDQS